MAGRYFHLIKFKYPCYKTTGNNNTANGSSSLYTNTTGNRNTANGTEALFTNNNGYQNTASGYQALYTNSSGYSNCAFGVEAMLSNTTGYSNTAIGFQSLKGNTLGVRNTSIGNGAFTSGTSFNNSAALGYDAEPGASNTIMLGNSSVTWIGGHSPWYNTSDERVKNDISEDVKGLDFVMKLRPVTYHIDKDAVDGIIRTLDESEYPEKYAVEAIRQSGFLAQEVEKAASESGYDFNGVSKSEGSGLYSLSYGLFVVPLVKSVQELAHRDEQFDEQLNGQQQIIEKQNKTIQELVSRIETLEKQLEGR